MFSIFCINSNFMKYTHMPYKQPQQTWSFKKIIIIKRNIIVLKGTGSQKKKYTIIDLKTFFLGNQNNIFWKMSVFIEIIFFCAPQKEKSNTGLEQRCWLNYDNVLDLSELSL